jgi:hypothetical protein
MIPSSGMNPSLDAENNLTYIGNSMDGPGLIAQNSPAGNFTETSPSAQTHSDNAFIFPRV